MDDDRTETSRLSGSSTTCSTSRGSRPGRRPRRPSSGRSTTSSARASRTRRARARPWRSLARRGPARARRRRQIERVLANLLENALKFSPPSSAVELSGRCRRRRPRHRVADRGPGLTTAELGGSSSPSSTATPPCSPRRGPRARDRAGLRAGQRRDPLGRAATPRRHGVRALAAASGAAPGARCERRPRPRRRRRATDPPRASVDAPRRRIRRRDGDRRPSRR